MLGSQSSGAVATSSTPVVVAAASTSSTSESESGIEQQLNALKGLLHPSAPSNAIIDSNANDAVPQPPTQMAPAPTPAQVVPPVPVVQVATAGASNSKDEEK